MEQPPKPEAVRPGRDGAGEKKKGTARNIGKCR